MDMCLNQFVQPFKKSENIKLFGNFPPVDDGGGANLSP